MIFDQADFFYLPLLDGRHGVGQVFELGDSTQHAAFCGLTLKTAAPGDAVEPLLLQDIIAFVLIHPDQFTGGQWPIGGFDSIPRYDSVYDYPGSKALGFPNTQLHEPAVLEAFLSACHGLYPWSAFGDLFDTIYRADIAKPPAARS